MKPGNQHDSFACKVPIPADYGLRDKDAFFNVVYDCFLTRMQFFVFLHANIMISNFAFERLMNIQG
jgi:hypothetical protein